MDDTTNSRMKDAADKTLAKTRQAGGWLGRAVDENPLLVGAAAMAVGAVVGLALPLSERENAMMGQARDNVVERAKDAARQKVDQVRRVAEDVGGLVGTKSGKDERG